jgi:hypothetical protein
MLIVSDTSPIANLILIDRLDILHQIFKKVIIPPAVEKEIVKLGELAIDLTTYYSCNWILRQAPKNDERVNFFKENLDTGESEAIALAEELEADYLLLDERLGTKVANELGLQTIGLLGVIVKAKNESYIERVKPLMDQLRAKGFRVSDKLVEIILERVGELLKNFIVKNNK